MEIGFGSLFGCLPDAGSGAVVAAGLGELWAGSAVCAGADGRGALWFGSADGRGALCTGSTAF